MEVLIVFLFFMFILAIQIVVVPLCLVVVLALFGIHVGFWAAVAVMIVLRVLFALLRGK